jgi:hypothetical protein
MPRLDSARMTSPGGVNVSGALAMGHNQGFGFESRLFKACGPKSGGSWRRGVNVTHLTLGLASPNVEIPPPNIAAFDL